MSPAQRQTTFDRLLVSLARKAAERLGVGFLGTITKLPPPPFPGQPLGATRYYLNALAKDGSRASLVEITGPADAALRRAERWVATGDGQAPEVEAGRVRAKH